MKRLENSKKTLPVIIKYLPVIVITILVLLSLIKPAYAATEHSLPPEVLTAFEQATSNLNELPEPGKIISGHVYPAYWELDSIKADNYTYEVIFRENILDEGGGNRWFGSLIIIKLRYIRPDDRNRIDDYIKSMQDTSRSFENYTSGNRYSALPNTYYDHMTKAVAGGHTLTTINNIDINDIYITFNFIKSDWVKAEIDTKYVRFSEVEPLVHILWSRLPEIDPSGSGTVTPPPSSPDTGDGDSTGHSTISVPDPKNGEGRTVVTLTPTGEPVSPINPISDTALPLAVGATAALTALGALGAALTNGTTPAEALGELKELLRGGRSPKDILANPRLHDKITDADGKQWVYYHRPGDLAGDGWTPAEEYQQTLKQNKQGKTYSERWGWTSKEEAQSYEANLERQRELEREDALKRQEEMRLAAQKRAEAERLRREAEAKALEERRAAAIRKRDEGLAKAEYWNRQARFYDYAAKSAELVKAGADKSIDMLADVTGPKGKTIRTAYRAATALAKGVGEGMASGNWTDSMTDAAGTMAADLMEGKIGSERYKKAYGVFREGAANAWQQGRQAWRTGEDVTGTAAQAFLEGAVAKASEDFKETLGTKGSYFYEAGEKAIKNSYNAFKDGATVKDALFESSAEALGSAGDSLVDHTLGQTFDRILPENVSSNSGLLNDIYADLKDEATGKVIEGTQSFLKGDGFNIEI